MFGFLVEFKWARDNEGHEFEADTHVGALRMRSAKLNWFDPMCFPSLFKEFASLKETPEACIEFANRYGLLCSPSVSARADRARSNILATPNEKVAESFSVWYFAIQKLRNLVEAREAGRLEEVLVKDWYDPRAFDAYLKIDPNDGEVKLCLKPQTLEDAIVLQFYQSVISSTDHKLCKNSRCNKWFRVGVGYRRRGSETCSDRCRYEFNNAKRSERTTN
jgi:hypothetical protein